MADKEEDDKEDDIKITLSEQVTAKMAADPKLAAAMREMFANMRQAAQGVHEGRYASFDEAMEAITGSRPELIEVDELPVIKLPEEDDHD